MSMNCPSCNDPAPEGARVCRSCGTPISKRCLYCAENIPAAALRCPVCASDLGAASAPAAKAPPPPAPAAPAPRAAPSYPVGENRHLVLVLLLTLVTCGIYGLVTMWKIGDELNRHRGSNDLNPTLDIVLGILTCGLWFIYARYRYAEALRDASAAEALPRQDVTTICLVVDVCAVFFGGLLSLVSLLILQNAVNEHWERHGA